MTATTRFATARTDIYAKVTERIVADLKRGVRPWHQPWNAEHAAGRICRPLRSNGKPYSGINILMLWAAAEDRGYACPYWMTFQQAKELGAHVRKGEHGSTVVYANRYTKTETNDAGDEVEREIPFLKQYTVFNAQQCEGLPARFSQLATPPNDTLERLNVVETFFANVGANVRTGGNRAYYSLDGDYIQMPPFEAFRDAESHASVLAHETCHWTRHPSRLARDLGRKKWGDAGYALEELVAELGAAFLAADLGVTPEVREDHAAYVAEWLTVLENDTRAVFTAASHASKAVDFLHARQPQPPE